MSIKMHEEAILEAKKIREMAEENAKNAIIRTIEPHIHDLVEKHLLGKEDDEEEDILLGAMRDSVDDARRTPLHDVPEELPKTDDGKVSLDLSALASRTDASSPQGPDASYDEDAFPMDPDEEGYVDHDQCFMTMESVEALAKILQVLRESSSSDDPRKRLSGRFILLKKLNEIYDSLNEDEKKLFRSLCKMVLKESKKIHNEMICITESSVGKKKFVAGRVKEMKKIFKETKDMTKRRLVENDPILEIDLLEDEDEDLPTAPGSSEESPDDADLDVSDLGPEDDDVIEEPSAAEDIVLKVEDPPEGVTPEDVEQILKSVRAVSGSEEDVDVEESDEVLEVDEDELKEEISRMRRVAEAKSAHDASVLDDFGGGKVTKEPFVDMDDSDLNVYAEVRNLRKRLKKESAHSLSLEAKLDETQEELNALKNRLTESDLFNAKLTYANKIILNKDVTPRTHRAIFEALDSAKTMREVKLLYAGLIRSIKESRSRRSRDAGALTEEVRLPRGSGSQPSKSSASVSLYENASADRWGVLAGLTEREKI